MELSDCTIQIVSAEKIDRQAWLQKYGTIMEDAEEHYRPCVYLSTKVTMDGQKDMHLKHVRAVQEEEDPQDPTRDRWGRCVYQNGELVGIYAFYEEGDKDLDLRFEGPGCRCSWKTTVRRSAQKRALRVSPAGFGRFPLQTPGSGPDALSS